MKKKNGFTLIELLAVIIILGILMIIAIPSVTSYINDSRKNAYVDTAKEVIGSARNLVNEGKLGMYDTNTTYYIPANYINTENSLKSPYGEFLDESAYIGVIYDGVGYKYYWISSDDTGQGIPDITLVDKLDTDDIKSDLNPEDIKTTVENTGIGNRTIIKILKIDGTWEDQIILSNTDNNVSEDGGSPSGSGSGGDTKLGPISFEGKGIDELVVGDPVKIGEEEFYVINNNFQNNTLTIMAKYNLKVGLYYSEEQGQKIEYGSQDSNYGLQSNNSGTIKYSDARTYLSNYKNLLIDLYKIPDSISFRQIKLNELQSLGCSNNYYNYSNGDSCINAQPWITTSSYWSQSLYSESGPKRFCVWGTSISAFKTSNDSYLGVRPVLDILVSDIED